jgi:hypothetical protein
MTILSGVAADGPMALGSAVIAVGALGTAAYGLVDVLKAWDQGLAIKGYRFIEKALTPYGSALETAAGSADRWKAAIKAHWINGEALDDQKAKAKALIHLGLSNANAAALAQASGGRIAEAAFTTAVANLNGAAAMTPADINVIGRFDAILSAELDAGYERADHAFRTSARGVACLVAVALSVVAGVLVDVQGGGKVDPGDMVLAVLIGLVATPLAPVAKDLASSLNTAAAAFKAAKG